MVEKADILVNSREGYPVATIEVKNRKNLSREVATDLLRNMLAHGALSSTDYFLLLSQDSGFLWKDVSGSTSSTPPTFEFPMSGIVSRYLPSMPSDKRLAESELRLLTLQWLNDMAQTKNGANGEPERSLAGLGFLESIKGASIVAEAPL